MPNTGPLPIVVTATGHIDLRPEDIAPLAVAIRQVFQELQTKYPHTDVELWSSLAEGADRLVAHVALDLGIRLVVPMPMDPHEYKKDFADAASAREFDALVAKASRSFVVPGPEGMTDLRPDCYARLAAYNVTHAQLVLALWNGKATNKVGGTAETVRFRLKGIPPRFSGFIRMLDPIETGVVHHILTPRRSDPGTDGAPFTCKLLAPERVGGEAAAREAFHRTCKRTDMFNALAGKPDPEAAARRLDSETRLRSDAGSRGSHVESVVTLYGYADELAIRFQQKTVWTLKNLFWLVFTAIVAFEIFDHFETPLAMLAYVVLLVGAIWLHRRARSNELDTKYLDFRALAEALRVEFYWRLAGVRSSAADYYMRYRLEETEWIRHALRTCGRLEGLQGATIDAPALDFVVKDWLKGQHAFFVDSVKRDAHRLEAHERWIAALWWISFVTAVGLLATYGFTEPPQWVLRVSLTVVGIFLAAAALMQGYLEKRALAAHIRRYTRMSRLFQSALRKIEEPLAQSDAGTVREVLRELGREALEENADWVMLHRERPLEVPQ